MLPRPTVEVPYINFDQDVRLVRAKIPLGSPVWVSGLGICLARGDGFYDPHTDESFPWNWSNMNPTDWDDCHVVSVIYGTSVPDAAVDFDLLEPDVAIPDTWTWALVREGGEDAKMVLVRRPVEETYFISKPSKNGTERVRFDFGSIEAIFPEIEEGK